MRASHLRKLQLNSTCLLSSPATQCTHTSRVPVKAATDLAALLGPEDNGIAQEGEETGEDGQKEAAPLLVVCRVAQAQAVQTHAGLLAHVRLKQHSLNVSMQQPQRKRSVQWVTAGW